MDEESQRKSHAGIRERASRRRHHEESWRRKVGERASRRRRHEESWRRKVGRNHGGAIIEVQGRIDRGDSWRRHNEDSHGG